MSSKLVLVLNCGSSSLKFAIIDPTTGDEYLTGLAECFNLPEARIKWKMDGAKHEAQLGAGAAHSEALRFIVKDIMGDKPELSAQIGCIGHRLVHGGEKFAHSVIVTDEVIKAMEECSAFAPLHNPANLLGVEEALKAFLTWLIKTLVFSIPLSIRPCLKKLTCMPCRTACTKTTVSAAMVSTVQATTSSAVKPLKC